MPSDHARVGRALDLLTEGLFPYLQQEMETVYRDGWAEAARSSCRNDRTAVLLLKLSPAEWDAHALLTVMWDQWNAVFRAKLGLFERSLVSELREFRNRWAHQSSFDDDDTYRVLDSAQRLLAAISAPAWHVAQLESLKLEVLREKLDRRLDDSLLRARAVRDRNLEILIYVLSGAAVMVTAVLAMVPRNPLAGLLLIGFTLLTFAYIVWQRTRQPIVIRGVHECPQCRKIVYTEECPYCVSARGTRSATASRLSSIATLRRPSQQPA